MLNETTGPGQCKGLSQAKTSCGVSSVEKKYAELFQAGWTGKKTGHDAAHNGCQRSSKRWGNESGGNAKYGMALQEGADLFVGAVLATG